MITSKQRAQLRAMANGIETIGQVGKDGINENLVTQVKDALTARQLVKYRVLETCPYTAREAAQELAAEIGAEIVQVIGYRFVLYLADKKNPLI